LRDPGEPARRCFFPVPRIDSFPIEKAMILADTHVHIYDFYRLDVFLDSALRNFTRSAPPGAPFTAILFLTETASCDWFTRLEACARDRGDPLKERLGTWRVEPREGGLSLRAVKEGEGSLFIIAGRQITAEGGIEVLALAARERIPDGLGLEETIEGVIRTGALPVLPWSAGKWRGATGRTVRRLLEKARPGTLCLGLSSVTPFWWPPPRLFSRCETKGIPVLCGTDPLPLPGEETKPGRFGSILEDSLDPRRPEADFLMVLRGSEKKISVFGSRESTFRFVKNQIRLKLGKRRGNP